MRERRPPMRAGLPMYDLPETRAATDAWWTGVAGWLRRAGLAGVPARLAHGEAREGLWTAPDLLLSQTCGYPLVHALAGRVRVVATPCYAAPGAVGACYASAIVVREDAAARALADLRGGVAAVNARDSHSGWNALRAAVAPLARDGRFFAEVRTTGAHVDSIAAVRAGAADACAVDCVTHALLARHRPHALAGTRVLGYTARAPGLPYVTRAEAGDDEVACLREALGGACADAGLAPARAALLLERFEVLSAHAYDAILAMEARADARLRAL